MNVNGTGPFTEWTNALTFAKDLDESQVPDRPEAMQARPGVSSITITWTPARSRDGNDILVRGYTIGTFFPSFGYSKSQIIFMA